MYEKYPLPVVEFKTGVTRKGTGSTKDAAGAAGPRGRTAPSPASKDPRQEVHAGHAGGQTGEVDRGALEAALGLDLRHEIRGGDVDEVAGAEEHQGGAAAGRGSRAASPWSGRPPWRWRSSAGRRRRRRARSAGRRTSYSPFIRLRIQPSPAYGICQLHESPISLIAWRLQERPPARPLTDDR